MKILDIRPEHGSGNTLARFDVQLTDTIKLFNIKLAQGWHGMRVYAPSAFGSSVATFSPELAEQLIVAAKSALGEKALNDNNNRAA